MFTIVMLLFNDSDELWQSIAAIFIVPDAMMCIASVAVLSVRTCARQCPEKQIERELQTCMRRDGVQVAEA